MRQVLTIIEKNKKFTPLESQPTSSSPLPPQEEDSGILVIIPEGNFIPGCMIRVRGVTDPGAKRFAINLQCGPNTGSQNRDDIALHLNFCFEEQCVVFNDLKDMNWGMEETSGFMPLIPGESFNALILCEENAIKIALNDTHFRTFSHRISFNLISHLTVDGDAEVHEIECENELQ